MKEQHSLSDFNRLLLHEYSYLKQVNNLLRGSKDDTHQFAEPGGFGPPFPNPAITNAHCQNLYDDTC